MIFSILALSAALFVQAPDQTPDQVQASVPSQASSQGPSQATVPSQGAQVVRVAAFSPSRPAAVQAEAPEPEPVAGDVEPAFEPVRTRQVCRYIEVTGQRFPVRSCRTVVIDQD